MNQITITMEATQENLKKLLQVFTEEAISSPCDLPAVPEKAEKPAKTTKAPAKKSATKANETPKEVPKKVADSEETLSLFDEGEVSKEVVQEAAKIFSDTYGKKALIAVFEEFGIQFLKDLDDTPEQYPALLEALEEAYESD